MSVMRRILGLFTGPCCRCPEFLVRGRQARVGLCSECFRPYMPRPRPAAEGGSCECHCCCAHLRQAEREEFAKSAVVGENPLPSVAAMEGGNRVPTAETLDALNEARRTRLHRNDGAPSMRELVEILRKREEERTEDVAKASDDRIAEAAEAMGAALRDIQKTLAGRVEPKSAHSTLAELLSDLQIRAGDLDEEGSIADGYAAACRLVMERMIEARATEGQSGAGRISSDPDYLPAATPDSSSPTSCD